VEVVERTRDAVVNITATQTVERTIRFSPFDYFFDIPGRKGNLKRTSLGSGFIIHPDGYVVTNAHVVAQAADQKVIIADGMEFEAPRVAVDERHDLAILHIETDRKFPALTLGRSHDLMIGETVIAIGNPLSYGHTVTSGIISAVNRELPVTNEVTYHDLIQTDAPINPGNSGGPLLNITGELIGINTAIRGDAQNIGFAIPVDSLRKLIPEMLSVESQRRLRIGLRLSWRDDTTVIEASGPAADAGIQPGDVLLSIDGTPIRQDVDFHIHLLQVDGGHPLRLELQRQDQRYAATLRPQRIPIPNGEQLLKAKFGITARLLTAMEARRLGIKGGLLITHVEAGSPADRAGIVPGHLLVQIGQHFPTDLDQVGLLLENVRRGEEVFVRVYEAQRQGLTVLVGHLVAR